jgi:hypothetical protein
MEDFGPLVAAVGVGKLGWRLVAEPTDWLGLTSCEGTAGEM